MSAWFFVRLVYATGFFMTYVVGPRAPRWVPWYMRYDDARKVDTTLPQDDDGRGEAYDLIQALVWPLGFVLAFGGGLVAVVVHLVRSTRA